MMQTALKAIENTDRGYAMLRESDVSMIQQLSSIGNLNSTSRMLFIGESLGGLASVAEYITGAGVVLVVDRYESMMKAQAIAPSVQVMQMSQGSLPFMMHSFDMIIKDDASKIECKAIWLDNLLKETGHIIVLEDAQQKAYANLLQTYTQHELSSISTNNAAMLEQHFEVMPVITLASEQIKSSLSLLKALRNAVLNSGIQSEMDQIELLMAIESDYLMGKIPAITVQGKLSVYKKVMTSNLLTAV